MKWSFGFSCGSEIFGFYYDFLNDNPGFDRLKESLGSVGVGQLSSIYFNDFQFEVEFLSAKDVAEIKLPELAGEAKSGPVPIEINNQLQTNRAPEIRQRNIGADRFQPHFRIKRKELPLVDETVEGITVEMIAVGRVAGPVGI